MKIAIDPESGFCFGVVYAIRKAEEELDTYGKLYCLGDIVHNNVEVARLKKKGLITINHEEFRKLKNEKVLIRAHGEPPETYLIALENNIELIEASCPVVLKLQKKIKSGYDVMRKINGQVVIFGKEGHAEVNGLVGQTKGDAIVINDRDDLNRIDFSRPVNLFAQTTKSIEDYKIIEALIRQKMKEVHDTKKIPFIVNKTICRQVSYRDHKLKEFAGRYDTIIFVSGKKSSNGKMLFDVCKMVNSETHFVSDSNDLQASWFCGKKTVGICGATSTPRWLMEKIANELMKNILPVTLC
ncbi:MAG: 4-hydroxy-3-methylbut-2-enyl diphosphate reductase [Bacteroidetes bacterium]|nr:4-hydroxy-3-methylbut-2-enyl diphosphate reductase [Bacteroidota bacterium]